MLFVSGLAHSKVHCSAVEHKVEHKIVTLFEHMVCVQFIKAEHMRSAFEHLNLPLMNTSCVFKRQDN